MFKKSDKKSQKSGKKFGITLISEDSSFRGDIHFQGCLEVQGSLKGQIVSEEPTGQVRVLSGGSVSGQISVPNVVINGDKRRFSNAGDATTYSDTRKAKAG